MNKRISRREALHLLAMTAAGTLAACQSVGRSTVQAGPTATVDLPPQSPTLTPRIEGADPTPTGTAVLNTPAAVVEPTADQAYLSVAHGAEPAAITEAALKALGGIERFVMSGYDVIIKPNICVDYNSYEYAATTNPEVVATLVRLALGAGAKRVRVMDYPFGGTAESAYARSGIAEAVQAAGGEMEIMNSNKYREVTIPNAKSLTKCQVYQEILDCDLLIDVPIAKNHSMATLTAGCKNLLGVIMDRGAIHADFSQRIPDLVELIRPGLTVVDAVRTLMDHGPTGGNLDDVKLSNMVIASHDIIAADAYATSLLNLTPSDIPYIVKAAERGLGSMDLSSLKVEEINV